MTNATIRNIFLSSRIGPDMEAVRAALKQAIAAKTPYNLVFGDASTGAKLAGPTEESLKALRTCDFIVILVDREVGAVTTEEWREAARLNMPGLVYFSKETSQQRRDAVIQDVLQGAPGALGVYNTFENSESGGLSIAIDIIVAGHEREVNALRGSGAHAFAEEVQGYFHLSGRQPTPVTNQVGGWGHFKAAGAGGSELVACFGEKVLLQHVEHVAARAKDSGATQFRIVSEWTFPGLLREEASKRGGVIQTINDYLMELTDIEAWFKEVEAEIDTQAIGDRYIRLSCDEQSLDSEYREVGTNPHDSLDTYADEWLAAAGRRQLAVLGDFGTGKSWFCLHLAHVGIQAIRASRPSRLPLLVRLGKLRQGEAQLDVVGHIAARLQVERHSRELVHALVANGRLLLILDGLDELAPTLDAAARAEALKHIGALGKGRSKTLLTSRRAQFNDLKSEVRDLQGGATHAEALSFEIVYLAEMTPTQIGEKVKQRFGHAGDIYLDRINRFPGLQALVRRPIVLDMVLGMLAEVTEAKSLTLRDIYERCTQRWLARAARPTSTLSEAERLALMRDLAWDLYRTQQRSVDRDVLPGLVENIAFAINENLDVTIEPTTRSEMLLVRDNAGAFSFAHRSFMEYFVASRLLQAIAAKEAGPLAEIPLTDALLAFMRDEPFETGELHQWLDAARGRRGDYLAGNLLSLMHARGVGLRGADLSGLYISDAILERADLRDVNLSGAHVHRARIAGADLSGADCTGATLTSLILGVKSSAKAIAWAPGQEGWIAGANATNEVILFRPQTEDRPIVLGAHSDSITGLSFGRDGRRLASVGFDRRLKIWDVESRSLLREVELEASTTYCVSLAAEDYGVALTGGNDNTVRSWSLADGGEGPSFNEHEDTVYAIAYSPVRRCFASASFDKSIILYSLCAPEVGFRVELSRRLKEKHTGLVNGVAIDPAGEVLAACDNDGKIYVRRWTGTRFQEQARIVAGDRHQAWSIAFSPDGAHAVAGFTNGDIVVWDCRNDWREAAVLSGHAGAVWEAVFDTSGERIATCSFDSTIRVWNWRSQTEVHRIDVGAPSDPGLTCRGMRIDGVSGLSPLQEAFLRSLGAE